MASGAGKLITKFHHSSGYAKGSISALRIAMSYRPSDRLIDSCIRSRWQVPSSLV